MCRERCTDKRSSQRRMNSWECTFEKQIGCRS
uniref:Uncharacterized protein n=1 Tax=Siphoviridae sp. ctZZK17 TaxID=2826384 RepID=A0A8S5MP50_9CAUD|nr:MAG TPA: hypothetical protein [Siphoviridae sp. ctZZK17]DAL79330.1 MAG TPA: hypothetical protein [Bacteriophage sp.]